ncbi:MAG: histidine ammonia-lyase [Acidobacteria bacterium]|nr:histidine ammonia-lyase [Acidobacteriota bacterium]
MDPGNEHEPLGLDGQALDLPGLEDVARSGRPVVLLPSARKAVGDARRVVDDAVARGAVVYGVTTGFGSFADVHIPLDRLRELQLNLLRSHAAGVGPPLGEAETRGLMLLRANVLARGFSGIRPETLDLLVAMLNRRVHPVVPSRGSVGASGDLAPLAHLALPLVGEGECRFEGRILDGSEALRAAGLEPVTLEPKEGLALINGTQLMTAVAGLALAEAWRLARTADVVGALTLDALLGTDVAFDERIHAARPHPGQATSARCLRRLLEGSAIRASHRDCGEVQDAYSLRCMPQVHGALRDTLHFVTETVTVEMNSATDNPMIFAETGEILSGGNFHGQPVALAADILAIVAAELGAISERRTERLVNPALSSGLPAFLARDGGLQSGLMMGHVTAAALASESKALAHPASVDSIPTSAGKEDHVSMGVTAAHKAAAIVANTRRVLGVELLAAAEALEFRRPLRTSPALEAVHERLRALVAARETDRILGPDIEAAAELIASGEILAAAEGVCGRLEDEGGRHRP